MRRLLFFTPLALFLVLGLYLSAGLSRDPAFLPSMLIDRPVPDFSLPPIQGRETGLAAADLDGDVRLLNVFGSWCAACLVEHPVLMEIAEEGVEIAGLNWKDKPGAGARWLARHGDPYSRIGDDAEGRVAIEFGVTGAPETFVIDSRGRIRHKHIGPITPELWRGTLKPMIEELRNAPPVGPADAASRSAGAGD